MKRNRKSILAKKITYFGKDRKMTPYGVVYDFDRNSSYFHETRFRKEIRRIEKKKARAQYKRELFSAIEDHISESMSIDIWCDFWRDHAVRVSPDEFDDYCASIGL